MFTAVSEYLAQNIQLRLKKFTSHTIIANAVDTGVFKPAFKKQEQPGAHFIHISTLTFQKNFDEIIDACAEVKREGFYFTLTVIAASDKYDMRIKKAGLENEIIFKKEMPQNLLAEEMQNSDALILYSLYETFGCVIIEANACGTPCIVSDIEVFKENVLENITGVFIPLHQPSLLARAMIKIIKEEILFDAKQIAAFADNYSMHSIGKSFLKEYEKSIGLTRNSDINSQEE